MGVKIFDEIGKESVSTRTKGATYGGDGPAPSLLDCSLAQATIFILALFAAMVFVSAIYTALQMPPTVYAEFQRSSRKSKSFFAERGGEGTDSEVPPLGGGP